MNNTPKNTDKKFYGQVHHWLRKNKEKTECEFCGKSGYLEYALKRELTYAFNIDNFFVLCKSCHVKYDYTEETRKIMSLARKGKPNIALRGRKHSEDTITKFSRARKEWWKNNPDAKPALGMRHSEETIKLFSEQRKGVPKSDEHKQKIRDGHTGFKYKRVVCERCDKEIAINVYTRWHGDKCKYFTNQINQTT